MLTKTKEEMFLEIYIPNILLKYLPKLRQHIGVESMTMIKEDLNGTTYKFIGYFEPEVLAKRITYQYQKEFNKHNKILQDTIKKELKKMSKELHK